MKKIFMSALALFLLTLANAQPKEGKVLYSRTSKIQIQLAGMSEEMQSQMPKTRTDKFELNFANSQSLWKQAEQENEDDGNFSSGGMQIRMVASGSNDVLYNNFETSKKVEQRELFDKKFIVDDSIRSLKWKMSEETKTILNHLCRKATATSYGKRMMMTMDNGKMERKEVDDTSNITAWFTSDIPVPAGPAEYQGQLPGLILEMDINNGKQVYEALEISTKADISAIKEPSGKKHYTPDEFAKERDKMMEEMQRNNGGGNRVIRMN